MEVVGLLRRWLLEEGLQTPMGRSGYRIRTQEVRVEKHKGSNVVVVLFRMAVDNRLRIATYDDRLFGFRSELVDAKGVDDPQGPSFDPPQSKAETILALLDEAISVGSRSAPDPEGIVWVQ